MKILIASFTFLPEENGVANVCFNHAEGFISNGHNVSIATKTNYQRDFGALKQKGYNIFEFDIYGGPNYNYKGEIDKYQKFLIESDFDIIFFHCLHNWNTDCALTVLKKIKAKTILVSHGYSGSIVYSLRGFINLFSINRLRYHFSLKNNLSGFNHLVFLANKTDRDRFYDKYIAEKFNLNSYSVIPNGVNLYESIEKFDFRKKYTINTRYFVLNVSSYSKLKNMIMALKAFHKSNVDDSTLVFIGSIKNEYSKMMENYCIKHKINNVIMLEKCSQDDIKKAYLAADLFLYSSHTELQPLAVLDAMGCGLPFISTNVGCVSLFKGGIVVKSIKEMAMKLRLLINDSDLRKHLGEEGENDAISNYNWGKIKTQYEELIKTLKE